MSHNNSAATVGPQADRAARKFSLPAFLLLASVSALMLAPATSASAAGDKRGLWVPNALGNTIVEFTASQRAATGAPVPELTNTSSALSFPAALVFDPSGNMWVVDEGTLSIDKFTRKQLTQLGTVPDPTPAVTITSSVFGNPLADFDRAGNLWVSDQVANSIYKFTKKQLKTGGDLTPAVTITSSALNGARNLAFDKKGNLWISNDGGDQIEEFAKKGLAQGGALTPAVIISDDGSGSLDDCAGIAFDRKGNLWVADVDSSTIVEFSAADLKATGNPTPVVTISANGASLDGPVGIGFDKKGNLWASNFSGSSIVEFSPAQIAASGTPVPIVTLSATSGSIDGPEQFSFGPSIN